MLKIAKFTTLLALIGNTITMISNNFRGNYSIGFMFLCMACYMVLQYNKLSKIPKVRILVITDKKKLTFSERLTINNRITSDNKVFTYINSDKFINDEKLREEKTKDVDFIFISFNLPDKTFWNINKIVDEKYANKKNEKV